MSYSAVDVARLLALSPAQVRSYARECLALEPHKGAYRFRFADLVLLRAAKELVAARVPKRRVRTALRRLRTELPDDRPLTGLQIGAEGHHVVVHDGSRRWDPGSGQLHFDLAVDELAKEAAPMAKRQARAAALRTLTADDWYELGCDLETPAPQEALDAYRRAVKLQPDFADARLNLGRLLHERGRLREAEEHYRAAVAAAPDDATAHYNLGVLLEDRGEDKNALRCYEDALKQDRNLADASFNAAAVCERLGHHAAAIRHLRHYRELARG